MAPKEQRQADHTSNEAEQADAAAVSAAASGLLGHLNQALAQAALRAPLSTSYLHVPIPRREDYNSMDKWYNAMLECVLTVDSMGTSDEMFRNGQRPTPPPSSQNSGVTSAGDSSEEDSVTNHQSGIDWPSLELPP